MGLVLFLCAALIEVSQLQPAPLEKSTCSLKFNTFDGRYQVQYVGPFTGKKVAFSNPIRCFLLSLVAIYLPIAVSAQDDIAGLNYCDHDGTASDSIVSGLDAATITGFFGIDGSKKPQVVVGGTEKQDNAIDK